jgi:pimeloyl-ACP methyl ester carboxylesterase
MQAMTARLKDNIVRKFLIYILAILSQILLLPCSGVYAQPWETLPDARPLPASVTGNRLEHGGARIWYGTVGTGEPVILLHGGMASSDGWGNQVPALIQGHHRVILIDSRGHGRSTLGNQPLSYGLMESDVVAVMDAMKLKKAAVVGWSDGANIGLVMAMKHPRRLTALYAFGANMDLDSVKPDAFSAPILKPLVGRLVKDYARLSPTPDGFSALHDAVEAMQKTEPNYSAAELAAIRGPRIMIADGDHEEFIKREHTRYLAKTIPGARLVFLPAVSHFAPWQAPEAFNTSMIDFLDRQK